MLLCLFLLRLLLLPLHDDGPFLLIDKCRFLFGTGFLFLQFVVLPPELVRAGNLLQKCSELLRILRGNGLHVTLQRKCSCQVSGIIANRGGRISEDLENEEVAGLDENAEGSELGVVVVPRDETAIDTVLAATGAGNGAGEVKLAAGAWEVVDEAYGGPATLGLLVAVVEGVPDAEQHVDEHDDAGGHGVPDYGVPGRVATAGVARVCVALPPSLCAHRWICVSIAGAAAVQLSRGK